MAATRTARQSRVRSAAVSLILLVAAFWFTGPLAPTPAAAAPAASLAPGPCATLDPQVAALDAQIAAHNAQVAANNNAAVAVVLNQQAAVLRAQKDALNAQVDACNAAALAAYAQLDSTGRDDYVYEPTQSAVDAVSAATASLDRSFTPPGPNARGQYRTPPELVALRDAVRPRSPGDVGSAPLQGQPRPAVGSPDPAFPGRTIPVSAASASTPNPVSATSPDHIVPLVEILQMPGFLQLTPANMLLVANSSANLQWLSTVANVRKSNRSAAAISGANPAWIADQVAAEDASRQRLLTAIQALLAIQQAYS